MKRRYKVYEVLFYWKTNKNVLKSFYKIGYTSYPLEARFAEELSNGIKIFVLNVIEVRNYKEAKSVEEQLLKLAQSSNQEEFEQYEDPEIGVGNFGDFHEYKFPYFSGSTEVFKTPLRFSRLLKKLPQYWNVNTQVYYPKKFNTTLSEQLNYRN